MTDKKLKQEKPTDPNMTIDVKNEEVEAQILVYMKEKTGEELNKLLELLRTRRVLVPANLNEENQPLPCLITSKEKGTFLPIYTSKEQIPAEPRSAAVVNMSYLAVNHMAAQQTDQILGIVINPFTHNLVVKNVLIEKIEEVEKARKEGKRTFQLTPEQYPLFERRQFEFGFLPDRFFKQGKEMIEELCGDKEEFIDRLFEESYQQKRMYPYLPEDFSVMVMNVSEELLIVRVDLPHREMGIPSCYRVYFAWNDRENQGRYFTIERTKEEKTHLLGEFGADLKHIDHGAAPVEGAELQKIIDLCKE